MVVSDTCVVRLFVCFLPMAAVCQDSSLIFSPINLEGICCCLKDVYITVNRGDCVSDGQRDWTVENRQVSRLALRLPAFSLIFFLGRCQRATSVPYIREKEAVHETRTRHDTCRCSVQPNTSFISNEIKGTF